jgi:hypothetical protein
MSAVRRGATLAEMAVALMVVGSAAALGAGLLLAAERRTRRDGNDSIAGQTTREAMHILGAEVASARWGSVFVRGDTALDLESHVGVAVVCAAAGSVLVLPPARTSLAEPWTSWRYPAEATDRIAVWDSAGAWTLATVDSVTSTTGGGCAAGGPFRSIADSIDREPMTRLRLSAPIVAAPGAPVRVFRAERWTLYRGGDRRWWLGQRRCTNGACGAAQPVAGPLASPADTGLRFVAGSQDDGRIDVYLRPEAGGSRARVARGQFTIRGISGGSP